MGIKQPLWLRRREKTKKRRRLKNKEQFTIKIIKRAEGISALAELPGKNQINIISKKLLWFGVIIG
jgi:hypothetical protein